jgi:hypothetical protein
MYRVIHKSLRDFRPLRYSSRDGHAEGEYVNRGIDTPIFYPTLQVLDMSTLGEAADVNPIIKLLPHKFSVCGRNFIIGLTPAASPKVDLSSTCKVGQKLWVSLPLLTCSPSAWSSRLLYRKCRKSGRDLRITLHLWLANSCVRFHRFILLCVPTYNSMNKAGSIWSVRKENLSFQSVFILTFRHRTSSI